MSKLKERFWSKVNKDGPIPAHRPELGPCWVWTGAKTPYGVIRVYGKMRGAHQVSWEISVGPIPAGLWILHKCDNPPCIRPSHLFTGTNTENQRDASDKSRSREMTKTHDRKGHPLFGDNLVIYKDRRKCKICNRENAQRIRDLKTGRN